MNRAGINSFDSRTALALIIVTTILSFVASLISLSSGFYIIFQNLFYIPIILACIFYLRRGLVFSILLSLLYLVLLLAFAGFVELENGIVRTVLFIAIASMVTIFEERIKEAEKKIKEKNHELNEANAELKKSRDRYHMLFESTGDSIYLHEIDPKNEVLGRFIEVNNTACESLGYTRDELLRLTALDIISYDKKDEVKEHIRAIYKKGGQTFESSHMRADGTIFPVEVNAHLIQNDDSSDFILSVARDITGRKQAEEALRKSEGHLRTLIQTIPDMVWLKDEEGIYLACNPMFEHLFGAKESEIKGKTDYDFLDKEDADFFREKDRQAVEAGKPMVNDEWITFADDGRRAYLETIKTPMYDSKGNLTGVLGIGRDLTERKKSEDALREVNRKLNLLSSITRHDILNQITGAAGYLEMIELDEVIPPGTKGDEYIKKISGAVDTIKRQISFTGYYKDLGEHAPDWFDVGNLVDKVSNTSSFGEIEHKNNIKNVEIFADPLFEKVIYNLIDNAIKHGNKITEISFYTLERPKELIIVCEDNGVGIPAGVKEKIFRRGYYKNSGLGLFLSREILTITGLTIEETGTPGKGARFEIHVPERKFRIKSS